MPLSSISTPSSLDMAKEASALALVNAILVALDEDPRLHRMVLGGKCPWDPENEFAKAKQSGVSSGTHARLKLKYLGAAHPEIRLSLKHLTPYLPSPLKTLLKEHALGALTVTGEWTRVHTLKKLQGYLLRIANLPKEQAKEVRELMKKELFSAWNMLEQGKALTNYAPEFMHSIQNVIDKHSVDDYFYAGNFEAHLNYFSFASPDFLKTRWLSSEQTKMIEEGLVLDKQVNVLGKSLVVPYLFKISQLQKASADFAGLAMQMFLSKLALKGASLKGAGSLTAELARPAVQELLGLAYEEELVDNAVPLFSKKEKEDSPVYAIAVVTFLDDKLELASLNLPRALMSKSSQLPWNNPALARQVFADQPANSFLYTPTLSKESKGPEALYASFLTTRATPLKDMCRVEDSLSELGAAFLELHTKVLSVEMAQLTETYDSKTLTQLTSDIEGFLGLDIVSRYETELGEILAVLEALVMTDCATMPAVLNNYDYASRKKRLLQGALSEIGLDSLSQENMDDSNTDWSEPSPPGLMALTDILMDVCEEISQLQENFNLEYLGKRVDCTNEEVVCPVTSIALNASLGYLEQNQVDLKKLCKFFENWAEPASENSLYEGITTPLIFGVGPLEEVLKDVQATESLVEVALLVDCLYDALSEMEELPPLDTVGFVVGFDVPTQSLMIHLYDGPDISLETDEPLMSIPLGLEELSCPGDAFEKGEILTEALTDKGLNAFSLVQADIQQYEMGLEAAEKEKTLVKELSKEVVDLAAIKALKAKLPPR